jgi:hypothetical protein
LRNPVLSSSPTLLLATIAMLWPLLLLLTALDGATAATTLYGGAQDVVLLQT